jgi:hypothetical protein
MNRKLFAIHRVRKSTRRAVGALAAGFAVAVIGVLVFSSGKAHARDDCLSNRYLHSEQAQEGQLVNPMQASRQPDSYVAVVYGPARGEGRARTVEHRFAGQATLQSCMDRLHKCWNGRERNQFRYCIKFDGTGNLAGYYSVN